MGGVLADPYDTAVRLLARRPHSRLELTRKLRRRGHDDDAIETALTRCAEHGYLDDAGFAAALVRARSRTRGRRAIAAELSQRGVGREQVDAALGGLETEDELAAAVALVRRRLNTRSQLPTLRELLDDAGPKLLRRGFSPGLVREACRQALDQ